MKYLAYFGAAILLFVGCATSGWETGAISRQKAAARAADKDAASRRIEAHARYAAGVVRELRGEEDHAIDEYTLAARNDLANEPLIIDLAQRLLQRNEASKAVDLLQQAAAVPDSTPLVDAWLGMALKQAGRHPEAEAAFRRAIREAPQLLFAHHGLAQLRLDQKQPGEALKVLESAAAQPNVSTTFLVDLAGLLALTGRAKAIEPAEANRRALAMLERVAMSNPTEPIVLQKMADTYKVIGELGRAAGLYLGLIERLPPTSHAARRLLREQLVRLHLAAGEKEKAARQLNAILDENNANPQASFLLGAIAAENKQYDEAAKHFEATIALEENFEPAYYDLAGVRLSQSNPEAALEVLNRARARFQRCFVMEFYSGVAQAAVKQYADAIKSFTDAELLAKTSEPSRLNHLFYAQLASVHAALAEETIAGDRADEASRHFGEAEKLLAKSLESAPDNPDALFQAGSIYERMANKAGSSKLTERAGRFYEEAEKLLRRCIELSPENAEALNYLGYMWADRGVHLDEARLLIERALKIEPDNAAFLDSLAWVLFKLGQTEPALKPMLEAIAKSPKPDATLLDHLGDIYAAMGRHEEAREAWSQSISVEDTPEVRRKIESKPAPSPR